jgi:hypothetical protein
MFDGPIFIDDPQNTDEWFADRLPPLVVNEKGHVVFSAPTVQDDQPYRSTEKL